MGHKEVWSPCSPGGVDDLMRVLAPVGPDEKVVPQKETTKEHLQRRHTKVATSPWNLADTQGVVLTEGKGTHYRWRLQNQPRGLWVLVSYQSVNPQRKIRSYSVTSSDPILL